MAGLAQELERSQIRERVEGGVKTVMVVVGNALLKKDRQKKDLVGIGWPGRRKTKEGSQYRSYWSANVRRKETRYPAVAEEESGNDLREARGRAVEAAGSARCWRGRKRD